MARRRVFLGISAALAFLALCAAAARAAGWERVDLPGTGSYTGLYVPGSLDPGVPAPAIVFLHGSGARPEDWRPLLVQIAEDLKVVLILPRAASDLGFGIGDDEGIVEAAMQEAGERVSLDPRRIGLAGHSAGGAYALVLAYATPASFSGVFSMSAPYRIVIRLADPVRPPPLRLYYGMLDHNFSPSAYGAVKTMMSRLGVAVSEDLQPDHGHSDIPDASLREGFAFLLAQPLPSCVPSPTALCLRQRFRVEARWETKQAQGNAGVVKLTDESGYLWFFAAANVELSVKVIDACSFNQRYWFFAAGTTDVGVELTVTDTASARQVVYRQPPGKAFAPVLDTGAFDTCP